MEERDLLGRPKLTWCESKISSLLDSVRNFHFYGFSPYRRLSAKSLQLRLKEKKVPVERDRIVNTHLDSKKGLKKQKTKKGKLVLTREIYFASYFALDLFVIWTDWYKWHIVWRLSRFINSTLVKKLELAKRSWWKQLSDFLYYVRLISYEPPKEYLRYGVSILGNRLTRIPKITWFLRKIFASRKVAGPVSGIINQKFAILSHFLA